MKLKITQIRSTINRKEDQKRTIAALGLGRIGRSRMHDDNPVIRGMIFKVSHLVKVEEVVEPVKKTASKKKVTKPTEKKAKVDSPKSVAKEDKTVKPATKKVESKEEKKEPVEKKKPAPAKKTDNDASEKATENK